MATSKPAVVLLSGGLDSATALAVAKSRGYTCYALSFDYGQRHRHELAAAERIAKTMGVARHVTAVIDLRVFGGSALTADLPVPKDQPLSHTAGCGLGAEIPITYVPARNTVFLSFALAWAEVLGAFDIFIGVNAIDYSGYPDCRPAFIRAFEDLANLATKAGVERHAAGVGGGGGAAVSAASAERAAGPGGFRVHAPLIEMSKAQIVKLGLTLSVPYALTHSCYDPVVGPDSVVRACGHCDSCRLRREGFVQAGTRDPIAYV
jgi:7-cyano-7-deazaguanine synthase